MEMFCLFMFVSDGVVSYECQSNTALESCQPGGAEPRSDMWGERRMGIFAEHCAVLVSARMCEERWSN